MLLRLPARGTRSILRQALAILLACGTAATAAADCDDWIDVRRIVTDSGIQLKAHNLTPYPLTYTLRVRSNDMRSIGPRVITETLPPNGSRSSLHLQSREAGRRGRYRYFCDWTVGDMQAEHDAEQLYLLPYGRGLSYRVLQGYGSRFSHTGREQFAVDFKMAVGTPVHAARSGVVARVVEANNKGCWEDGCGRYANFIVVLHDDGTTGEYYHLQQNGALVEPGERVEAGQKIGLSGNTGHTTMPHLHFAVYRAIDKGRTQSLPVRFLSADGIVSQPRRGGRYPAAAAEALLQLQDANAARRSD